MTNAVHLFEEIRQQGITHVDIGFARYALVIRGDLPNDEWAHTDTDLHEIALRSDLSDGQAREFLMHELTHCVLEVVGYTGENDDATYADTNEDMTIKLSRGFLLLCRLNPRLVQLVSTWP